MADVLQSPSFFVHYRTSCEAEDSGKLVWRFLTARMIEVPHNSAGGMISRAVVR